MVHIKGAAHWADPKTIALQAADLFSGEEQTSEANKCRLKVSISLHPTKKLLLIKALRHACSSVPLQVAQFSSELGKYTEAIAIYEDVAKRCVDNNLLKYSAKGYLLNAGICHLCGKPFISHHIQAVQAIGASLSWACIYAHASTLNR